MDNKDIRTDSRLLIAEILTDPNIAPIMNKLLVKKHPVFRHCINVAYLTAEICFNLKMENIADVVKGAILHDIGKIYIPDEILFKPGKLSNEEFNMIKKHPIMGYNMVRDIESISQTTKEIILSHHEKISRDSYPYNKDSIPKPVQIVTVCDMYDALTEKRTYGKENSPYDALCIIADEVDKELYLMIASCKEK